MTAPPPLFGPTPAPQQPYKPTAPSPHYDHTPQPPPYGYTPEPPPYAYTPGPPGAAPYGASPQPPAYGGSQAPPSAQPAHFAQPSFPPPRFAQPAHFAPQQVAAPASAVPNARNTRRPRALVADDVLDPNASSEVVALPAPAQILTAGMFLGVPLFLATLIVAVLALRSDPGGVDGAQQAPGTALGSPPPAMMAPGTNPGALPGAQKKAADAPASQP